MSSLSDLIQKRSEELNVQRGMSIQMKPDEAAWLKQKKLIDSLSSDYVTTLKDKLTQNTKFVKKTEFDKNFSILIFFPEYSQKYKTMLEIIEHKKKGVTQATYLAYNKETNTMYVRELVKNDL